MEQPRRTAPTPITKSPRAMNAEIAGLRRENDRLQDPELPKYVRLVAALTEGKGLTVDLTVDLAIDMQDFAEFNDMPMCRDMVQSYFEYWESRALARVVERTPASVAAAPGSSLAATLLAFRKVNKG
jgi:hypothetical protein